MKNKIYILKTVVFTLSICFCFFFSFAQDKCNLATYYGNSCGEIRFTENHGQMADMQGNPVNDLLFKTGASGVDMYITKWGLSYIFIKGGDEEQEVEKSGVVRKRGEENRNIEYCRADMELVGACIKTENIFKEYESPDFSNYYLSHCVGGILNVKRYGKIIIREVYPNIDWVIYSAPSSNKVGPGKETVNEVKYDFIVHPGGNPSQIKFKYKWTDRPNKKEDGSLTIGTPLGNIIEGSPFSYMQETNSPIQTAYAINRETNEISFTTTNYNSSQTLIIDPQVVWSTYFGGNSLDGPVTICKDNLNNIYFTGYDASSDFPVQNPGGGAYFQGVLANAKGVATDVIVVKFNNAGILLWATYYGGSGDDKGTGITCDTLGNLFVTGTTSSSNFPELYPGGVAYYQGILSGPRDLFILKFNSSGVSQWATFYGGSAYEDNGRIAADNAGNVFILAATGSTDLPLKNPGGGAYYQSTYGGGNFDACIMEFTNAGVLQWATYYGGSGQDGGTMTSGATNINVSSTGDVFICGYTNSGNSFPLQTLAGAYNQSTSGGSFDAFILKFNNVGVRQWATFFGGNGNDKGCAINCDLSGNLYVAGSTVSTNLPVLNPGGGAYYQPANAGGTSDLFITEFNTAGNLTWCTYYGGSNLDGGYYNMGIGKDSSDNLFLCGYTNSTDFPLVNPGCGAYFQNTILGNATNAFIAEWNNAHVLVWATYYGGNFSNDLVVDSSNCLFVTGESNFTGVATTNPGGGAYYQTTFYSDEGMIMKLAPASPSLNVSVASTSLTCNNPCADTATANSSSCFPPYTYLWNTTPVQSTQTATGLCAGSYTVTVKDAASGTATAMVTIAAPVGVTGIVTSTAATCGSKDGSATVTTSGGTGSFTYSWSPAGQTTAIVTGLSAGTYTVTITDGNNCSTTSTAIVGSTGGAYVAGIISAVRDTICSGTRGTLTLNGSSGTPLQWQSASVTGNFSNINGDTSTSYLTNPMLQTTRYRVILGTGVCADTSKVFTLIVMPTPVAAFSYTSIGKQVTFNSTGTSADVTTYRWDFNDGSTSAAQHPVHVYATDTTFYVCLTVYNGSNCSYTLCQNVYLDSATGIGNVSATENFIIYPNPFNNTISIITKSSERIESVEIYDVLGQKIYTKGQEMKNEIQGISSFTIFLPGLTEGIYFLKIGTGNSNYFQRIIKQ